VPDDEALRSVFEAEHERLWRSLLAYAGDADVASDAAAEAFAQALRRGDGLRDPAAWVWRAASRIAAGLLAARRREGGPVPGGAVAGAGADTRPDEVAALLDALARLGPTDRRVVVLALVGGLSAAEIGVVVGASPGAVRVRLHRARRRLRDMLGAEAATGPGTPGRDR
jgi:RNA polymerase sigma-70 factor (ECF subfamily)